MSEGKARPSRIKPETVEREAKVLQLRRGGLTFDLIAKELGWRPQINLQEGLKNTMEYYLKYHVHYW